jgi:hypothetical protein
VLVFLWLSIFSKISVSKDWGIAPTIEAFFNMLTNWNMTKGAIIVSLRKNTPLNPSSTSKTIVNKTIQVNNVFNTLRALNVLKPSLLDPDQIPKKPSTNTTETRAKYCSAFSRVKLKKYEHTKAANVETERIVASKDVFINIWIESYKSKLTRIQPSFAHKYY